MCLKWSNRQLIGVDELTVWMHDCADRIVYNDDSNDVPLVDGTRSRSKNYKSRIKVFITSLHIHGGGKRTWYVRGKT